MRIIAGVAKGRTLSQVAGGIRPTSDRAREAIFSSLLSEFGDFAGVHFLDLFGGSGAIGLEALSRGASVVHIVEKNDGACKTITANYGLVAKSGVAGIFHLYSMSVQRFLEIPPPNLYDIVYIDPPYDFPEIELHQILSRLHEGTFLQSGAVIAVERARKFGGLTWPGGLEAVRERNYGQALIYYGKAAENG